MERTFVMIKPDGVQRALVGHIISRFESKGLKLCALKLVRPPRAVLEKHYAEHAERPFFDPLVAHMASGPVVASVWEGRNAVAVVRQMLGATDPGKSAPGTIRGDLGLDVRMNLCHASDALESADREIDLWFPEGVLAYGLDSLRWVNEQPAQ